MSEVDFRPAPSQVALATLAIAAVVGIPFALAGLLDQFSVRSLALLGTLALAVGALIRVRMTQTWLGPGLALSAVTLGLAIFSENRVWLLLLPALVNLDLAWLFGQSLRTEPPMIERAARALQPNLPGFVKPYCRWATWSWTGFFLLNIGVISWLALSGRVEAWRAYAGPIYAGLVLTLLLADAVVRKLYFRNYGGHWLDRILERVLPAENTELGRQSSAHIRAMRESGRH